MILVDTPVWIDHLRGHGSSLAGLLGRGEVLGTHGSPASSPRAPAWRAETLRLLGQLPQPSVATPAGLLEFIEVHELFGLGIGYVDAQLLVARG